MKTIDELATELSEKQNLGFMEEPIYEAVITTAKFMNRWIPIEEELPPLELPVIVKALFVGREITYLVRRILNKELASGWQWSCLEIKTYSTIIVISWKPIEYETITNPQK